MKDTTVQHTTQMNLLSYFCFRKHKL